MMDPGIAPHEPEAETEGLPFEEDTCPRCGNAATVGDNGGPCQGCTNEMAGAIYFGPPIHAEWR